MSGQSPWQLDAAIAKLGRRALAAHLELDSPARGLTQLSLAGTPLATPAEILGVSLAPGSPLVGNTAAGAPLEEAYTRGPDLVATYSPSGELPFRYQAYWREQSAHYAGALGAIELVVSIQTQLLDSRPQLTVCSLLPASDCWRWTGAGSGAAPCAAIACPPAAACSFSATDGIGLFRCRLAGGRLDYVEMVHPVDFQRSTLAAVGATGTRLSHRLLGGELEKGVILRARVLGLIVSSSTDNATLAGYYRAFEEEALPLTT